MNPKKTNHDVQKQSVIKPLGPAILFVVFIAIFLLAINTETTVKTPTPTKESVWSGTTIIKVQFPGSKYPDIKDVTTNPTLAGIKVANNGNTIEVQNLNKDFITLSYEPVVGKEAGITEIVAPKKVISIPLAKEIFIAFPNPRIIRGGPNTYYFDFGH